MSSKDILMGAAGATPAIYVEDVFSTYVYTGNGSTQTINNGIDLAGKGGLVWTKMRNSSVRHVFIDSARGNFELSSDSTGAQAANSDISFNSTGYSLANNTGGVNNNTNTFASWTFRKQPKFFDIVTYTGNGSARTIAHSLGAAPGMVIVKRTDTTGNWQVYHGSLTSAAYSIQLNSTAAQASAPTVWNSTAPTSSVFSVGTDATVNASGGTYIAYLFAHNAGGFGLTGTDNVISCGSWTQTGSGATVTLGYEPQWILLKSSSGANNWRIVDNMRGMTASNTDQVLVPNAPGAETAEAGIIPTATGFNVGTYFGTSGDFIYIAIRRGPMKVPTDGTSVFSPLSSGTSNGKVTTGWPADALISTPQANATGGNYFGSRLQGNTYYLSTSTSSAETVYSTAMIWNTVQNGYENTFSQSPYDPIADWAFRRAPGFFDQVCYTGDGTSALVLNHNLQAVPQLIIVKDRSNANRWQVYSATTGASAYLILNTTAASFVSSSMWNATTPTSTTFTVGDIGDNNVSANTYVAYLFASCPGVSKVGSFTGTGATQTINCGFTGGARFILIKRTDSTGDWYVWDTARGIVAANDPHLSLNTTAAEVTTDDSIDPDSTGFIVNQVVATNINVSSATYIYLAIA